MIEIYAFLAMSAVQILTSFAVHTVAFIRFLRVTLSNLPDGNPAKAIPVAARAVETFFTIYRGVHVVIAVFGFAALGRLFDYLQRPDWNVTTVTMLSPAYFALTLLPMMLLGVLYLVMRFRGLEVPLPERKRTAVLQRRGLFDFVSPFTVSLAVAGYFLSIALGFYLDLKPLRVLLIISVLTLANATTAFLVYRGLYAKKSNPNEPHSDRVRRIGWEVKSSVYGSIAGAAFFCVLMIGKSELARWMPFVMSVYMVIVTFEVYKDFTVLPSKPDADGLGSGQKVTPA